MKKKICIIIGICIICVLLSVLGFKIYQYFRIKNAVIEVTLVKDLTLEFNEKKKISDFIENINGKIINDKYIESTKIGKKDITFKYINDDNIKVEYTYTIEVVDNVKPLIWLGSRYRVEQGSDIDLTKKILCGDNYDNKPICTIKGDYDLNVIGEYPLTFEAKDQSGNIEQVEFVLEVYEKEESKSNVETDYQEFSDIVKEYKNENTQIGIDVSSWQGDINFATLKEAGVEFIIIRVGGTRGTNGEYFLDTKFKQNIKGANEYKIPVGIYFYSYADSVESARKDAKWVLKQIKKYNVELPIAFDWEEWGNFNDYNLSFFGLTSMAEVFLKTVEKEKYKGMLYSSKAYLDNIWFPTKYDIWLAHYTKNTTYKNYKYWQICNNGKVAGINGAVDIDIRKLKTTTE